MSQAYTVTTVKQLRDILSGLLSAEIGTFSNGATAYWVEPPTLPSNLTCSGLQCIINRQPSVRSSNANFNWQIEKNLDWIVTLTQFDRTEAGMKKLDAAITKMRLRFPRCRERIIGIEDDLIFPQVTFLLNFTVLYNGYLI